jgi:hypothetical protein
LPECLSLPRRNWRSAWCSLTDGRRTAGTGRQVQRLFNRHGATEVFVRVATLRQARDRDAEYGFERAVERARLAAQLGVPLNPELGLWAVYGDITRQPPPDFTDYPYIRLPGPWLSLTLAQMEDALAQYGSLVARQILSTGVHVNYWDLGNEVEWGVAGVAIRSFNQAGYSPPDTIDPAIGQMSAVQLLGMPETARIAWLQQHLWPYVGRLLAATAQGVRSADPAARFSTHLASIGMQDATFHTAFWQAMNQARYYPSQFGTSLYPTNGDPGDRGRLPHHRPDAAAAVRQDAVLRRVRLSLRPDGAAVRLEQHPARVPADPRRAIALPARPGHLIGRHRGGRRHQALGTGLLHQPARHLAAHEPIHPRRHRQTRPGRHPASPPRPPHPAIAW